MGRCRADHGAIGRAIGYGGVVLWVCSAHVRRTGHCYAHADLAREHRAELVARRAAACWRPEMGPVLARGADRRHCDVGRPQLPVSVHEEPRGQQYPDGAGPDGRDPERGCGLWPIGSPADPVGDAKAADAWLGGAHCARALVLAHPDTLGGATRPTAARVLVLDDLGGRCISREQACAGWYGRHCAGAVQQCVFWHGWFSRRIVGRDGL